jgi:hypothetical protein
VAIQVALTTKPSATSSA